MSWRAASRICRARKQVVQALILLDSNVVSGLPSSFSSAAAFFNTSAARYEIGIDSKSSASSSQRENNSNVKDGVLTPIK
jgi:hypothetical protein